jgi:hypothetical protein
MYFEYFPLTLYTLDDGTTVEVVTNIFLRNVINEEIKNNLSLFDEYDIVDGETPEILSHKFYRTSTLHWLILHYNEILDPRFDWPLSTNNLIKYCQNKYDNINAAHHYINAEGYIVNSTEIGATPVSNYAHEEQINESKRRIKILKTIYVDSLVREFVNKISE